MEYSDIYLLNNKKVFIEIPEKQLRNGSYSLVTVRDEDYHLIATFSDNLKEVNNNEKNNRTR